MAGIAELNVCVADAVSVVTESCSSQGGAKMAAQGTPNYVYFVDQQLGLGASGNVYLGRHKVTHLYVQLFPP